MYGEYGRSIKQANDPRRAKQVILGYLGNDYLQMVSGSNSLGFTAAPLKALVDLKTMKLELMEEYTETKLQRYTVDEMIEHCNSLHK